MKRLAQIAGIAFMLAGGLWTLQGLGIVMWPDQSFMLAQREWAIKGAIVFALGLGAFVWGRRNRV